MPHRPAIPRRAQRGMRLVQQRGKHSEVPGAVRAQRWFQFGGVPSPGHDVRGDLRSTSLPRGALIFPIIRTPAPAGP